MATLEGAPPLRSVRPAGDLVAALGRGGRFGLARPSLWPIGLLGFLARGGLLLLLLPILALPSPVGLSTLVGPDLLDANGISERVQVLLMAATIIAATIVWGALLVSAAADTACFARLTTDPEAPLLVRPGASAPPRGRALGWLVVELAALQAMLLLPAALASVPAAVRVADVAREELLLPSRLEIPLVARVVQGSAGPLLAVALLLVLGEVLYARLGRELLIGRCGLAHRPGWRGSLGGAMLIGLSRLLRRPLDLVAAELAGWSVVGIAAGLGIGALAAAWPLVEAAYLAGADVGDPAPQAARILGLIAQAVVTILFVALLAVVLAVVGAAAAVRSTLLTAASLRGLGGEGWTDGRD